MSKLIFGIDKRSFDNSRENFPNEMTIDFYMFYPSLKNQISRKSSKNQIYTQKNTKPEVDRLSLASPSQSHLKNQQY